MKYISSFILIIFLTSYYATAQKEAGVIDAMNKIFNSERFDSVFYNHRISNDKELYVIREDTILSQELKKYYPESYPLIKLDTLKQIVFLSQELMFDNLIKYYIDLVEFVRQEDTLNIKIDLISFHISNETILSQFDFRLVFNKEWHIQNENIIVKEVSRKPDIMIEIEKDSR